MLRESDEMEMRDEASEQVAAFETVVRTDARKVARRTLRYKFGRLSNKRILSLIKPLAADHPEFAGASDQRLLDTWFSAYEESLAELRRLRSVPEARD